MATKTSFENKHLGNGDYFVIISDRACCRWTGRNTVEVNVEYQSFKVVFALNLETSDCHLAHCIKELS